MSRTVWYKSWAPWWPSKDRRRGNTILWEGGSCECEMAQKDNIKKTAPPELAPGAGLLHKTYVELWLWGDRADNPVMTDTHQMCTLHLYHSIISCYCSILDRKSFYPNFFNISKAGLCKYKQTCRISHEANRQKFFCLSRMTWVDYQQITADLSNWSKLLGN